MERRADIGSQPPVSVQWHVLSLEVKTVLAQWAGLELGGHLTIHLIIGLLYREWVHVLTRQDLEQERYGLEDVVLPIMGSSTIFPDNAVADRYVHCMCSKQRCSDCVWRTDLCTTKH